MDFLNQYSIQFSGLSNGEHRFEFEIGDRFFEEFEYAIVKRGNVAVVVDLIKSTNMLTLMFHFTGNVEVTCDRCACVSPFPVSGNERLIVQLGEMETDDDELVILARGEHEFNIASHIYEYIALSIPLRIVPCEVTNDFTYCDQTVIAKLDALKQTEDQDHPIDPRWDKLRGLTNNSE